MSHAATNWAIQQRGLKPTTKIVLWHLCDRFNPDYGCFPSQERLAQDCEIGRATLNRHLDDLEACGLIRRIRTVDSKTGQRRPTRYLLGFEHGFTPSGPGEPEGDDTAPFEAQAPQMPCPDMRHGPDPEKASTDNDSSAQNSSEPCLDLEQGAMSHFGAIPCLKNDDSHVSKRDNNLVREPLSKPVKEEEGARARDIVSDDFFEELLSALGFEPTALPGWWQGWPPREHVRRWRDDLGLDEEAILSVAEDTRQNHREPPDGPKALDRAMERASLRLKQASPRSAVKGQAGAAGRQAHGQRSTSPAAPSADEKAAFYADLVNSDRFLPSSAISNTMRDDMLARGLVTVERLRERGVR
jgi:hypothetical protein